MFKMKILMIGCLLTVSAACFSGDKIGNGGFVISCNGKTQLFDYYQAEHSGKKIATIPGGTLTDKVLALLTKLSQIDPNRAAIYKNNFSMWNYLKQDIAVQGIHLDASQAADPQLQVKFGLGKISIPQNCELILALQQTPPVYQYPAGPSLMSVRVFKPVWDKLDMDTQAALVLHELFYRDYLLMNCDDYGNGVNLTAESVRYLNGVLGTEEFLSLDRDDWIKIVRSQKFIPMFPDYTIISGVESLEYQDENQKMHNGQDYNYWHNWFSVTMQGEQNLFGDQVLNIQPYTTKFIYGLYPEQFYLNTPADINLDSYSKFPLSINVSNRCAIRVHASVGKKSANEVELSSIGYFPKALETVNPDLQCFLVKYENPSLKFSGAVSVNFGSEIYLKATEFSILQWFNGRVWKNVSEIWINAATGELEKYVLSI
jgi:hypothetical protein